MVLLGGGLMITGEASSDIGFSIAAFGALIGAGILMPTLITWMVCGLPFAVRGRGVGIFRSLFSTGQFISGLIVPILARNVVNGVLSAFFLLCVIGLILAVLAVVRSFVDAPARPPANAKAWPRPTMIYGAQKRMMEIALAASARAPASDRSRRGRPPGLRGLGSVDALEIAPASFLGDPSPNSGEGEQARGDCGAEIEVDASMSVISCRACLIRITAGCCFYSRVASAPWLHWRTGRR